MPARKYAVNHHFFRSITTEVQAYLLGFIAADGSIRDSGALDFSTCRRDRSHLKKINHILGSNNPITDRAVAPHVPMSCLTICSRVLTNDLIALGIVPRKSLILQPWQGPDELMRHYWRGLVDGDGWIRRKPPKNDWQIGLCGTPSITEAFAKSVSDHVGSKAKAHSTKAKSWEVSFGGRYQCSQIAKFLYGDAAIFLDRKKKIADELMATSLRPFSTSNVPAVHATDVDRLLAKAINLGYRLAE